MLIEYQITTTGQCERFEDIPKGVAVLFIDGKEFIANCENCGKHLVDGDDFHMDEDGVYLCRPCANELFEAEEHDRQPQLVTHEMALDAGDPSLEGQEI